ncbi:MAG TPA: 50S ribosomal protein L23 [Planctomycetota bacterium]|nr:50S ribosomal protein L23 [Planctomycetota bacterium]
MQNPYDTLRKPLVTEKTMAGQQKGVYTFVVGMDVNKIDVKQAVEKIYTVKVASVRMVRVKGKSKRMKNMLLEGRRKDWKKAYVKLKEGFRLDVI